MTTETAAPAKGELVPAADQNPIATYLRTLTTEEFVREIQRIGAERIDREIVRITGDMSNLVDQASRAKCENGEDFVNCGDLVKLLKVRVNLGEDLRKDTAGPFDKMFKAFNAVFKTKYDPARKAIEHIETNVMKPWADAEGRRRQAEQEKLRREEEDRRLAEAAEQERQAKALREKEDAARAAGNTEQADIIGLQAESVEQAVEKTLEAATTIPVADTSVRRQRGMYGSTSGVKKVWVTKVVDVSKLPPAYIAAINADEKALDRIRIAIGDLVTAAIAADPKAVERGAVTIPGLSVTHENDISVR